MTRARLATETRKVIKRCRKDHFELRKYEESSCRRATRGRRLVNRHVVSCHVPANRRTLGKAVCGHRVKLDLHIIRPGEQSVGSGQPEQFEMSEMMDAIDKFKNNNAAGADWLSHFRILQRCTKTAGGYLAVVLRRLSSPQRNTGKPQHSTNCSSVQRQRQRDSVET